MPEILEVAFGAPPLKARVIDVHAPEDEHELCFSRGWSDGLPVVPSDPGAGAAHAQGHDARSAGGRRRDPAEQCVVHGREGRDQRGHGGLQA